MSSATQPFRRDLTRNMPEGLPRADLAEMEISRSFILKTEIWMIFSMICSEIFFMVDRAREAVASTAETSAEDFAAPVLEEARVLTGGALTAAAIP